MFDIFASTFFCASWMLTIRALLIGLVDYRDL